MPNSFNGLKKLLPRLAWILLFAFFHLPASAAVLEERSGGELESSRDISLDLANGFDAGQTQRRVSTFNESYLYPEYPGAPSHNKLPPPSIFFPEGDKVHFKLEGVIFSGNTVFTNSELSVLFAEYINKDINLNQLQSIVDLVTKKYHDNGYILSRANLPPQTINKGIVHVEIIEGYVSQISFAGKPANTTSLQKKYANHVLQSKPLKIQVLERNLLLANDLSGMSVKAIINPSKTVKDSADMIFYSTYKPVNAYISYDNFGSRYLGPQEISYGASLNSLLFPGDSNTFHFMTTSTHKEVEYLEFIHYQPIGGSGLNFTIGTNYTQTVPGFVLRDLDVVSRSASIYGNLSYPLIRSRSKNWYVTASANYQNVTSSLLTFPLYQDRFRTLALGTDFDVYDRFQGYDTLSLNLMHGFTLWGADPHFYQSVFNGQPRFTLATFSASRLQPLGSHFSFYAATQGQYSCNVLLAMEQFGFGGPLYGRGYDPYQLAGDRGIDGKAELRFALAPGLKFLDTIQFYLFYDAGMIWLINNIDVSARQDATSTGGGVRIHFTSHVDADLYIGKPLTMPDTALLIIPANGNQARGYFQLTARL